MASASRVGTPGPNVSARASASSIRACRSRAQAANSAGIVAAARRERLEHPALQYLDLLLRVLESGLAERNELGAALVRGERIGERQLAALHRGDNALELGERGFEILRGGHVRS